MLPRRERPSAGLRPERTANGTEERPGHSMLAQASGFRQRFGYFARSVSVRRLTPRCFAELVSVTVNCTRSEWRRPSSLRDLRESFKTTVFDLPAVSLKRTEPSEMRRFLAAAYAFTVLPLSAPVLF